MSSFLHTLAVGWFLVTIVSVTSANAICSIPFSSVTTVSVSRTTSLSS